MIIAFSPQRRDDALTLEKTNGDRLRINGELFNFNPLGNGDTIPAGAIPCDWIVGPVERTDGEVHLSIVLPHGPNPSQAVAFPESITVSEDGPIAVPHDLTVEEIEAIANNPDIAKDDVMMILDRARELGWDIEVSTRELLERFDVDA